MANPDQPKAYTYDIVRLRPDEQIGLHSQPTWELNHIVRGRGMRVVGDRQQSFGEGEVVLIPPAMPHCWYFEAAGDDAKIENVCLQISAEWLRSLPHSLPGIREAVARILGLETAVKFGGAAARDIASALVAMNGQTAFQRLISVLRIIGMLATGAAAEAIGRPVAIDRNDERSKNVGLYVACNFQRGVTLAAAARHVGLSRTAFCRWMRRHMHTTFAAYVLSVRLQKAASLLRGTPGGTISQIAYQSGFSDISHFNRMFKREYGVSPRDYRRREKG